MSKYFYIYKKAHFFYSLAGVGDTFDSQKVLTARNYLINKWSNVESYSTYVKAGFTLNQVYKLLKDKIIDLILNIKVIYLDQYSMAKITRQQVKGIFVLDSKEKYYGKVYMLQPQYVNYTDSREEVETLIHEMTHGITELIKAKGFYDENKISNIVRDPENLVNQKYKKEKTPESKVSYPFIGEEQIARATQFKFKWSLPDKTNPQDLVNNITNSYKNIVIESTNSPGIYKLYSTEKDNYPITHLPQDLMYLISPFIVGPSQNYDPEKNIIYVLINFNNISKMFNQVAELENKKDIFVG